MPCFLTDRSVKTDHSNIHFWLCVIIIHFTELDTVSHMTVSGSNKSRAAPICHEQRIPPFSGTGRLQFHSTWAGLVRGTASSSARRGQGMSQVQGVQIGGAGDGDQVKVTYIRSGDNLHSRKQGWPRCIFAHFWWDSGTEWTPSPLVCSGSCKLLVPATCKIVCFQATRIIKLGKVGLLATENYIISHYAVLP